MAPPVNPTTLFHLDWPKITETVLGSAGGSYVLYFLGRRAQKWREKTDTRTADQKAIDQLMAANAATQGRVTILEQKMDEAHTKIEDLRTEKMDLQNQITTLQKDIALLEVKKAEFESRETLFNAQIAELQLLLATKSSQLLCAEEKLKALEDKKGMEDKRDNSF